MTICVLAGAASTGATPVEQAAAQGERLFSGSRPLANGGLACATCHSAAPLPFPHGGSLGPDLTRIHDRLGPQAMQAMLATLFYPTMVPVYRGRQLTPAEQADLLAFFTLAAGSAPRSAVPVWLLLGAVLGCLGLLLATSLIWRNRLRPVRERLVEQARQAGGEVGP